MTNREWLENLHPAYHNSFFKWVEEHFYELKEIGADNWLNQEHKEDKNGKIILR